MSSANIVRDYMQLFVKHVKPITKPVHVTCELVHTPSLAFQLKRSMSHTAYAETLAQPLLDQCREGETILANYFIDSKSIARV